MKYKVELRERSHYVVGLKTDCGNYEDSILIYHYDGGDIDTLMKDANMMLGALYDLFQVSDNLHDGDTFDTTFGEFICQGVHVVPVVVVTEPRDTVQDFRDSSIDTFVNNEE